MTLAILGTDGAGAVGMAVTSSSPAVAARCSHVRAGTGVAASQNVTDPSLGEQLLDALSEGWEPDLAIERVVFGHRWADHRQLAVLAPDGRGAAFTGAKALGISADRVGNGAVAAGNILARSGVVDALIEGFAVSSGDLEDRLLAALRAGLDAGGEAGPVHSAGVVVARAVSWPETDLRVDWAEEPVAELGRLLERWLPQRDDYVTRGLDPTAAPGYGVPGEG